MKFSAALRYNDHRRRGWGEFAALAPRQAAAQCWKWVISAGGADSLSGHVPGPGGCARCRWRKYLLPSYRFVIADDHPLFRGALREARFGLFADATIVEAGSLDEAAALLDKENDLDLVLLDLSMPGVRGFFGLMYLRAQYPSIPVVVVSANDEAAVIRRCMEFGASGFIPKTLGVEAMREAISRVLEGGVWTPPDVDLKAGTDAETADLLARLSTLTPQQVRVLMMLSEGLLNKQIAFNLSVSEATVKAHVSAILQKLGVESRTQAVIAAAKIESGQWPQPVS